MTKVARLPVPKNIGEATILLEQHARIGAAIAAFEARRRADIAAIEADADFFITPQIEAQERIAAALAPWWAKEGEHLTKGKRKSIELSGCVVGTKKASESVDHSAIGDADAALAAIDGAKLNAKATATKRVLDKKAIAALLKGKAAAGAALRRLGFKISGGEDVFYVKRVDSEAAKVSAQG